VATANRRKFGWFFFDEEKRVNGKCQFPPVSKKKQIIFVFCDLRHEKLAADGETTGKKLAGGEKRKPQQETCSVCRAMVPKQSLKRHMLKHRQQKGVQSPEPVQPVYEDDR
jgi:hypothetical protein